jgi:MFS family permease
MAMLLAHLPPLRRAGRTLLWAVAGFGAATIVFGLSRSYPLSLAMMFLVGALDNVSVVVRHTLVQMLTPDPMRGRVSAVNSVFIVASNDLGGLESGVTAALVGPVASVVLGGIGTILVVIGAARIWPQILTIGSLRDIRPAAAAQAELAADSERAMRG